MSTVLIFSSVPGVEPVVLDVNHVTNPECIFTKKSYDVGDRDLTYNLYYYARQAIHGRWPEAEPYIIGSPESACLYARHVIKNRWLEAEPIIRSSDFWWGAYCKFFGLDRDV